MIIHKNSVPLFNIKHDCFKSYFFPSTVIEWNKLDYNIRNSESLVLFKKHRLAFISPFANRTFQCHNFEGLKLITRLKLGLSHFRFHKFKHRFQHTLNPICNSGTFETTVHYLLHCPNFSNERLTFFNKIQSIYENILRKDVCNISKSFSVVITHLIK